MSNPIVAHTNSYHTYSFEEALAGIQQAGYKFVELSAVRGWTEHVDVVESDPEAVARLLGDHGLTAMAVSGHSDLTTDEGLELALRCVEWTKAYGLNLMTTAIGGHSHQSENLSEFMKRVEPLAASAEEHGVVVAFEIHGEIMSTGAKTRPIIEQIDSPFIRVKYDTANCEYYGAVHAVDDIHNVVDMLVNIDAKDFKGKAGEWNFPAPGDGDIDWPRLVKIVNDGGYTGPYTVEVEFEGEPWPALDVVNASMRTAFETLSALVS